MLAWSNGVGGVGVPASLRPGAGGARPWGGRCGRSGDERLAPALARTGERARGLCPRFSLKHLSEHPGCRLHIPKALPWPAKAARSRAMRSNGARCPACGGGARRSICRSLVPSDAGARRVRCGREWCQYAEEVLSSTMGRLGGRVWPVGYAGRASRRVKAFLRVPTSRPTASRPRSHFLLRRSVFRNTTPRLFSLS